MCIIQKRTKDNSLTVFNPVEGLNMDDMKSDRMIDVQLQRKLLADMEDLKREPAQNFPRTLRTKDDMDNNFTDYVKDDNPYESDLYFLESAVKDAEFYIGYAKNRITMPAKDIPKPLRKRIKKLGIDLK